MMIFAFELAVARQISAIARLKTYSAPAETADGVCTACEDPPPDLSALPLRSERHFPDPYPGGVIRRANELDAGGFYCASNGQ